MHPILLKFMPWKVMGLAHLRQGNIPFERHCQSSFEVGIQCFDVARFQMMTESPSGLEIQFGGSVII